MTDRAVTLVSVVSFGARRSVGGVSLRPRDMIRLLRGCGFETEDLHSPARNRNCKRGPLESTTTNSAAGARFCGGQGRPPRVRRETLARPTWSVGSCELCQPRTEADRQACHGE